MWDADLCIDCGKCAIVCPHAAIRMKAYPAEDLAGAPEDFLSKAYGGRELPAGTRLTIQVAPDDCTGCGICVDVCPARSKSEAKHKAIDLLPAVEHRDVERVRYDFFLGIPEIDRSAVRHDTVKGSQLLQPLFEFSGACSGCGETPYLKLLSQQFGDRMVVANATGCSSIYGGNLPTTPWAKDALGRGPAWSNSLFEDNAEFGLGMRLGADAQREEARRLLAELADEVGTELARELIEDEPGPEDEEGIARQRGLVVQLRAQLAGRSDERARALDSLADALVPVSVWIIGGDGWAYDIGFGGLDHVLSSGRNVNILVLDTEVYSNTGGQASKSTPRAATAKFASNGKTTRKKDLGLLAQAYGDVYVAQIALGANETQTVRAMREATAHDGPSLIIAYSTCIAHGIDMATSMTHQKQAVASGYWPLYRYHPSPEQGSHPFSLDSKKPTVPLHEFHENETRFAVLDAQRPAAGRAPAGARPGGRRREVALLRAARGRRAQHPRGRARGGGAARSRGGAGREGRDMTALQTTYLGLELTTPLVASPSPATGKLDTLLRLEDAGVGAVVLPSLFEEEVESEAITFHERRETGAGVSGEAMDYFPDVDLDHLGLERHVLLVEEAVERLDDPGHRQRQRAVGRGLGALRAGSRQRRGQGDRAQHVRRRRRPGSDVGRRRARVPRSRSCRLRRGRRPRRRQAVPVLLVVRQLRGPGRGGGGRRARPVQPVLPAGPRPRDARRHPAARAVPAG